ncbi:MAG: hypothetical protein IPJ33_16445 [Gammaproteobacteria bacterium]|nr:hypothetical protein [Gammaproteobacteria bacterium]MBP6052541.1 hypothetical protein [Pseudomonadales bacterium]MBK6583100.1 hypothetical protein [Gammaproteobacteria bacterium]MBK7168017.1 hypothetical protein [Gammaproteobacteria bacterium]MBK7519229.1 hypothetical protein [Gammaproteobacteria bacterium]
MSETTGRRLSMVQMRRMLRRLERAHSGDEGVCPACSLQRLAAQLVEELEYESHQLASPELRPGAASVTMAVEALITIIYTLDVRGADEQGRVLQALLDQVGGIVLDQLAQEEMNAAGAGEQDAGDSEPAPPRRGGSLH